MNEKEAFKKAHPEAEIIIKAVPEEIDEITASTITKAEVRELEKAMINAGLKDTLDVIKKREANRRAAAIEKAAAPLQREHAELVQKVEGLRTYQARVEFETSPAGELERLAQNRARMTGETIEKARADVTLQHPELYEAELQAKAQRILAKAAIEKQERQDD